MFIYPFFQASGKLVVLDQLLQKLRNSGHRLLLFAQMTHTLDVLQVSFLLLHMDIKEMPAVPIHLQMFNSLNSFEIQDYMELRKYPYERLDGSIRAEERFAAIRSFSRQSVMGNFNSEPDPATAFVFMISTRAGGVGLNLVAADTVTFII